MSRPSRRHRTKQMAFSEAQAANLSQGHQILIDLGYRYCASSRAWQRRDGSATIRLVYRAAAGRDDLVQSLVMSIRIHGHTL